MDKKAKFKDSFQPAVLSKEEREVFFHQQNDPTKSAELKEIIKELNESVEKLSNRINEIRDEIEQLSSDNMPEIQLSRLQKYKKASLLKRMMNYFQDK